MKRVLAILLAIMMVSMFTACSRPAPEPEPEEAADETVVTNQTAGIVEDLDDGELTIYTSAKESLTFDIENAEIKTVDEIQTGDEATVEYTGEVEDGDTSDCEVSRVINAAGQRETLNGKVIDIDVSRDMIFVNSNDKEYKFSFREVHSQGATILKDDEVAIEYAGVISGTNASHAYVKNIKVTKKAEAKVEIKAVSEKVWTKDKVKVRAESSSDSEKVATLKKGKKLQRTGILSNGWSRVTYKDKDRYIKTKYLTTEKPKTKDDGKIASTAAGTAADTASKESTSKDKAKSGTEDTKPADDAAEEKPAADDDQTAKEEQPAEDEPSGEDQPAADEPAADEPSGDDEPAAEEPAEKETVKVKGVVTAYNEKDQILTVKTQKDGKDVELLFQVKDAKTKLKLAESVDMNVIVEYVKDDDDSKEAKHEAVEITADEVQAEAAEPAEAETDEAADTKSAETGSAFSGGSSMILIIAVIAIIAGAGVALSRKRRKDE